VLIVISFDGYADRFLAAYGRKAAAKLTPGQSDLVCLLYCSSYSAYYNAFVSMVRLLIHSLL